MSEVTETNEASEKTDNEVSDEFTLLKQRAKLMGLKVSPNIGLETLRAKLAAALAADEAPAAEEEELEEEAPEMPDVPPMIAQEKRPKLNETPNDIRQRLRRDKLKLVRIRVTCLNPGKKDLPGEIFTLANKYIGTIRKYVPFGDQTENGYHVPYCIYEMMKSRKFLHIRTAKAKYNGVDVQTSYVPEFAIEILTALTAKDLKELAIRQSAAAGKL
jgi:hypothetical protein